MPPLTVPERHRPGLAAILRLNHDTVDALITALTLSSSSRASTASVLAKLPPVTTDISDDELQVIVRTVLSLYALRVTREVSANDLSKDIVDAIVSGEYRELKVTDEQAADLHNKLTKLLGVDPLAYQMKARDVARQHERSFCAARILTDIRPIFGLASDNAPVDAVITHTLKITYHEGSDRDTKELFFAMDDDDIQELKAILERAEMKSESLKELLDDMELNRAD
jgi:hypothetical protein